MWPFPSSEERSPRLGVLSPLDVEIYDSTGDWTYNGRVEMFKKDISKEKGSVYFYRILTKYEEDEKVVVSTQDFIHMADQIPYTQTRKGKARLFQVFLLSFLGIYGLTLWLMGVMIQAGPSIIFYQSQVAGIEMDVADVAIAFMSIAGSWAWAARYHHFVSDWDIQPLRINSLKKNTDFYILTHSSKFPVYEEASKLNGIERSGIDRLTDKVAEYYTKEMEMLKGDKSTLPEILKQNYSNLVDILRKEKSDIDTLVDAIRQFPGKEIDRLQESVTDLAGTLQDVHNNAFTMGALALDAGMVTKIEKGRYMPDRSRTFLVVGLAVAITFIASFLIFVVR